MTCAAPFDIHSLCRSTAARTGTLRLGRGHVKTPVFMPVGTQAAIRSVPPHHIRAEGAQIILANTYHLQQRPGESLIDKMGGLHKFMGVDLPILTDSGGFQVFSLRKKSITEEGVQFSYDLDGKQTFLSPERSMQIQQLLASDIAMAFDECLPPESTFAETEKSIDMTARWAERCIKAHTKPDQSLFGIVQGGMFGELRKRSVQQITSLPFDGFSIGGLSVGEGPDKMNEILGETMPLMPTKTARYLMGVGRPQDLVDGVATGIDMFDCVIPTRHARGGVLYTFQGRIRISHSSYRRDAYPIDTACGCYTCTHFSRAYLHHLFDIGEILGATLATIHNLRFFSDLMAKVRASIDDGTFASFRKDIKALYPEKDAEPTVHDDAVLEPLAVEAKKKFARDAKPQVERPIPTARPNARPDSRPPRPAFGDPRAARPEPRASRPEPRPPRPEPRPPRPEAPPARPEPRAPRPDLAAAKPERNKFQRDDRKPGGAKPQPRKGR